jgi:excisionase family DNA binding protein
MSTAMTQEPPKDAWHTIEQTMSILQCSRSKVYRLWREGRLEFVKFDRGTRVTDRSLKKLMTDLMNPNGDVA